MKKIIGIPLMLLISIMLAGLVSAGTFVTPEAAGRMWGDYELNVSVTMANVENCTITGTSATSADTFTVNLYNQTLYAAAGNVNGTLATAVESDASDWSLTGTCYNTTGTSETVTTRGSITIDNTAPVCTLTSAQVSNGEYVPTSTWTVTGTSATGATIEFGPGNILSMTEASDVFTYDTRVVEGLYDINIYTSDGTNTTYCTELVDVNIRYDDNAQVAGAISLSGNLKKTGDDGKDNTIVILIAVAAAAAWYYKKKK